MSTALDRNGLPSIETVLKPGNQHLRIRYIQPRALHEIEYLHEDPPHEARMLAVRSLILPAGSAVPFHFHPGDKEKLYIHRSGSFLVYMMFGDGVIAPLPLTKSSETQFVPARVPHALVSCGPETGKMFVVASTKGTVVVWESDAPRLWKNEHLNPVPSPTQHGHGDFTLI